MIIDSHVHIGGSNVGFNMTKDMVSCMIDKYDIRFALISNADAAEMDHEQRLLPVSCQTTQEEALEDLLKYVKQQPNRMGACVWVKPTLQGVTSKLETLIKENRSLIYAIKLHPFHSNVSPIDPKVIPYLKLAQKYELPVVSHTGGCEAADAYHLYEAAKRFPTIPFVMVHMGLGTDNKKALELLGRLENLYGDTTWVPMTTTIEAVERYGSKKILFGSDAPIDGIDTYLCNKEGERSIYQDYFHILPQIISKTAYEDLMYKNACSLFKLPKELVEDKNKI